MLCKAIQSGAIAVSLLSLVVSCGPDESKLSSLQSVSQPEAAKDCEAVWKTMRAEYKAGEITKYRTVSESKYGDYATKSVSEDKQTVLSNTADKIVLKYEISMEGAAPQVSESIMDHATVVQQCKSAPDAPTPKSDSGKERVTVPAGTFDTTWTHTVSTQNNMEIDTKIFFAKLSSGRLLLVKSLTKMKMSYGSTDSERVLLQTNKK